MKMKALPTKSFRIFLAIGFIVIGTQCGLPTATGVAALERNVEINPKPNAIVGMWHKREISPTFRVTSSMLFTKNGLIYQKMKISGGMLGVNVVKEPAAASGRYRYDGNGWWSMVDEESSGRFRLAESKLLHYKVLRNGKTHVNVYSRVE